MPWHVEANHPDCADSSPWAVVADDDGTVVSCEADEDAANAKVADLYAAEGDASIQPRYAATSDQVLKSIYTTFQPVVSVTPSSPVAPANELPIESYSQGRWRGPLAVEGVPTGDAPRREFATDSLIWRDVPLSLYYQQVTGEMHGNASIVARIDKVSREGNQVVGEGVFDMEGEIGREAHRLVHGGFLRGLSVSLDDVDENDVEEIYPEDSGEAEGEGFEMMFLMPEKVIFHHARIVDALLTGQPALQEAFLELVPDRADAEPAPSVAASGRRLRVVTSAGNGVPVGASGGSTMSGSISFGTPYMTGTWTNTNTLVAAGGPALPPREWFADPNLSAPTPLTTTPDGRVFGHLAQFGTCHMTFTERCVVPPRDDDFSYFNLKAIPTREGDYVNVGNLTFGTEHAPLDLGVVPAKQHYENTSHVAADVHAGADRFGIWVAGAARPDLSPTQMRTLQGASVSGDWRWREGRYRLVHGLLCNVPGFPIPRLRTYVHDGQQTALVASGVVTQRTTDRWKMRQVNDRIAKSIGRDHPTRRAAAYARVHPGVRS